MIIESAWSDSGWKAGGLDGDRCTGLRARFEIKGVEGVGGTCGTITSSVSLESQLLNDGSHPNIELA